MNALCLILINIIQCFRPVICFKPVDPRDVLCPGSNNLSCPVIGQSNVLSLIDLRDGCVMPWFKQFSCPVIGQSNVLSLIDPRDVSCPGSSNLSCPVIGQSNVLSLIDLKDGCHALAQAILSCPVIGQSNVLSLIDPRDVSCPGSSNFIMPCNWSEQCFKPDWS